MKPPSIQSGEELDERPEAKKANSEIPKKQAVKEIQKKHSLEHDHEAE